MYSIDTSSIIEGRRRLYPPQAFPSLWHQIEDVIAEGDLRASKAVKDELGRRSDEVNGWASAQAGLFVPHTLEIQQSVAEVMAAHPGLVNVGKGRSAGDPWVIAVAKANGWTVVSEETTSGKVNEPRIPNVCESMGIRCIRLVDLICEQKWSF